MSQSGTLLHITLLDERYGRPFLASMALHLALLGLAFLAPYLLPSPAVIQIGTGPGGGMGGESYAVGVADDLGGGEGMIKPSLIPQPPALPPEKVAKEEPKEAVAIPDTVAPKKTVPKQQPVTQSKAKKVLPAQSTNVIPTSPMPGAGGAGGLGGGTGGGRGGGNGVSIGSGSGGFGDSWYARVVESRISSNWIRPPEGVKVEMVYSFFIAGDGSIYNVTKEKSSGNEAMDLAAERAIRASNPLAAPPPEFRGRPVQFVAQFVFPPTP
jgi:TonB family protein